jgi:cytochrome c oxidase subunit II
VRPTRTITPQRRSVPRRRGRRAAGVALASGLVLATATGCTANEIIFLDIPEPATEQAHSIFYLWQGAWVAAWAVGIVTWGLMLFAAFVYNRRRKKDVIPEQVAYNIPIEILYTIVPLVMILGLFVFTARAQTDVLKVNDDQQHTVNVVGYRWSWGFNYVDEQVYSAGTPNEIPTLVLPVNEKIRFQLTSPDVIHSFWVPDFLFKMDVIPGRLNQFELTPDKLGTFPGRCAELCGVDHSRMLFNVKVVERAEYDAYIAELKAQGQTGQLDTGRVQTNANRAGEKTL